MNNFTAKICSCFANRLYWWIFGLAAVYTGGDILFTYLQFKQLFYIDTDCYTHAERLIYWLQNFSWYEQIYPFGNYPFGEVLHFTRLLDIIWAGLALPFMPFFSLKDAVFYSGMLLSPLCLILSLITIFWGLKPYIAQTPKVLFFSLILSLAFFVKFSTLFDFTRPDHHSVIFLFFAYNLSAVLQNLAKKRFSLLFFAGILAGCGIWISSAVEGFILAASILGLLCFNWLFNIFSLKHLQIYSLGLFCAVAAAFLLNPPYGGYFELSTTRLSLLHVVLTLLICLSFYILGLFKLQTAAAKIITIFCCAFISAALLCGIFGFSTIFAPIYDENVKRYFLPYITEMEPLWHFVYLLEMTVFEAALVLLILFYKPQKSRILEINLALLFGLFFIPLLFAQRFMAYELCILAYLNIVFLNLLFCRATPDQADKSLAFGYICAALFLLASFKYEPLHPLKSFEVPQNSVVLSDTFAAPQLIFDRNIKTVAIPYHSAAAGIADNHRIFFSGNETEIKELLQKHRVEYIFLPYSSYDGSAYYIAPAQHTDKFYGKIITGKNLYPWLEKLSTGSKDILYKINYQEF